MEKTFSIVMPIYGNEKNIPITVSYMMAHLNLFPDYKVELIMICDGSPDNSYKIMKEYQKKYPAIIRIASLTRNFGQAAACSCGLKMARGNVIGIISADLQDPFEIFADMLKEWENGYKLVIATREDRKDRGTVAIASKIMHKLINKFVNSNYPEGGFDFFIMDAEIKDALLKYDTSNSSTQLLLLWLGYEYKNLSYIRRERTVGKSGYTIKKKFNTAIDFLISFSAFPLRCVTGGGIGLVGFSILTIIAAVILFILDYAMWGSILLIVSVIIGVGGIILCSIGVVAEYLWRMFDMQKGLPRYVVDEIIERR